MPIPGEALFGNNANDRYANPFYGVAARYLPHQSIDEQLWWANHFLLRFGFYRSALSRISQYFITGLSIECDDSEAKQKYEAMFEQLGWKQRLAETGLNLLAYGNVYLSVNQGFTRFLKCPKCSKFTNLDRCDDYKFSERGEFTYTCPSPTCKFSGKHEVVDKPSKDLERSSYTLWNPREIVVMHEEVTNQSEFYWRIPPTYKQKALKDGDTFYSKRTPTVFYEAMLAEKLVKFNSRNFLHLKFPTPKGIRTDGRAIPPCIYLFDDFFMLKVLQRYNEALCFEDITPFRVVSLMTDSSTQSNPLLGMGAGQWRAAVEDMVKEHRRDPGAYHVFPFPLNFQHLGGDAKQLVPTELMAQSISNILNALCVPQELFTMSLTNQAVGPALRLFENSWSVLVDTYNEALNHWADVLGKIKGLPKAKVSLIPATMSDDMEKKSVLSQLVASNSIAHSELLNLYNLDFEEQLRKKMKEENIRKDLAKEDAVKQELESLSQAGAGLGGQPGTTPQDVLSQADELAQQLFPLDAAQRREQLQQIKAHDAELWGVVKSKLQDLTSSAKSQGVQQAKAQQAQPA